LEEITPLEVIITEAAKPILIKVVMATGKLQVWAIYLRIFPIAAIESLLRAI
jgi:hypothetical protein